MVAFKFLENPSASGMFTAGLMSLALAVFFISIFSDSIYYHDRFRFGSELINCPKIRGEWIGYMKECGLPDDPLNERITKDIKPYILELKKDIAKIDGYRKSNHLEEMKMALLNDWKRYRMASYENVFRDIMDLTSDN